MRSWPLLTKLYAQDHLHILHTRYYLYITYLLPIKSSTEKRHDFVENFVEGLYDNLLIEPISSHWVWIKLGFDFMVSYSFKDQYIPLFLNRVWNLSYKVGNSDPLFSLRTK